MNASGLMLNQKNTMRIPSASQRKGINCFDMNFLSFEKKTELLPSTNLAPMFVSQFESSPSWSIRTWLDHLQGRGGSKKRFQYCTDPNKSEALLYLRALQGHSGGTQLDPSLQDLVVLPDDFAEYIYHVGNSTNLHSVTRSGLIAGGRDAK